MPGCKNPGIFIYKGINMSSVRRVTSYPDGRVVFYYDDREVIYRENEVPEIRSRMYNKKGTYGFLDGAADIPYSSRSLGWH